MSRRNSFSIFAHAADHGTNVAYFLGAVVPLFALGIVIERYVLAPFQPATEQALSLDRPATLGLFISIATLSFACFFVLRRIVRRTIEENRSLALYDPLTGLPNRRRYQERLEKAIARAERTGELVANCFIDLDGFKRINDSLGHRAGDQLLMQVARQILGVVRPSDWVGRPTVDPGDGDIPVSRLGGDEFTLILTGMGVDQDAGRVARRVLDALSKPFILNRQEVRVTASIGIAIYPNDGLDADSLLRNADTAMYSAKKNGRNGYRYYSSSMNEEAEGKIELERRLRRAITNEEFTLCFQPIRETKTGATRAAEALIRWQDPELGLIAPDDFIPIAEDTGLIVEIGSWVLRAACEQACSWQKMGFQSIRIAVNVSGHQIRQPDFVEKVATALRETGLSPLDLELEITESTIMQEDEATDLAFRHLHELGVPIALDDFGTGYSSLSYLRRFNISRLKIDRSFVARIPNDPEDMAVTAAIVAMAHQLLLPVVGEGVETIEQAQSLTEIDCDELQGYLFSRPLSASDFERFLSREKDSRVDTI
jgi:predicted signal transduction protein with EAL and GGDEF domain